MINRRSRESGDSYKFQFVRVRGLQSFRNLSEPFTLRGEKRKKEGKKIARSSRNALTPHFACRRETKGEGAQYFFPSFRVFVSGFAEPPSNLQVSEV